MSTGKAGYFYRMLRLFSWKLHLFVGTFTGEFLGSLSIIVPDAIACGSVKIAEVGKLVGFVKHRLGVGICRKGFVLHLYTSFQTSFCILEFICIN